VRFTAAAEFPNEKGAADEGASIISLGPRSSRVYANYYRTIFLTISGAMRVTEKKPSEGLEVFTDFQLETKIITLHDKYR